MRILELTTGHPDRKRVLGLLTEEQRTELWDDGRHDLTEVPDSAAWWVTVDEHDVVLALAAMWQEPDGTWRSGCNAELGWRDRTERHWPDLHHARQPAIAALAAPVITWLHDEEGAPPGTSSVVRTHLDTGWTLTGADGILGDDGKYARQLAWHPGQQPGLRSDASR